MRGWLLQPAVSLDGMFTCQLHHACVEQHLGQECRGDAVLSCALALASGEHHSSTGVLHHLTLEGVMQAEPTFNLIP